LSRTLPWTASMESIYTLIAFFFFIKCLLVDALEQRGPLPLVAKTTSDLDNFVSNKMLTISP